MKKLLSVLLVLTMVGQILGIAMSEECLHVSKHRIEVTLEEYPVYLKINDTQQGKEYHKTLYETWEYWECDQCHQRFSGKPLPEKDVIKVEKHDIVVNPEVKATCSSEGKTEGKYCSKCGEILDEQKTIPAIAHTSEDIPAVQATCMKSGLTAGKKCSTCGAILEAQQVVAALGHTPVVLPEIAVTCTKAGMKAGVKCSVCGEVLLAQQEVAAIGHKPQAIPEVAATCTTTGLTAGSKCSVCGEILIAQQVVEMTAHTPVVDPAVAPTYTEAGLTEGSHCSVCGAVLKAQETVPMLIQPSKIRLDKKGTVTLRMLETLSLKATINPVNAESALKWESSNKKVAKVSQSGVVTPVGKGTATITVTTVNGKSASVVIKVIGPKPTGIEVTQGRKATLYMGNKLVLKTKLTPSNAETTLTWKSSNNKVATVSKKGVITPKGAGTATITVKTENGKSAGVTVKVVDATGIKLNKGKSATLYMGNKLTLHATVTPSKVKSKLTWSSSNTKVATVSSSGVVTPKKAGTTKITVETANGKKATCKITVPAAPTKVTLNKKSASLKVGKTLALKATLTPTKAGTALTWISSNKKVATVTSKGVVKAIKPGKAIITVETANGKKATVTITVKK